MMRKVLALFALLALAACQRDPEVPNCAAGAEGCASPAQEESTAQAEPSATASADGIDKSALTERKIPERVLGYLAEAVNSQKWDDAALAWAPGEMTGTKAKELFGNPQTPLLTFGKGQQEGAAGSSYYEAPILLIASGKQTEGTVTLRRVNDVPGAEDWQLVWHVERLEWKD